MAEMNNKPRFRSSIPVPCVQELTKNPIVEIPPRYIRPDLHHLPIVSAASKIPVIDMSNLLSDASIDSELTRLHSACENWGFFQMITNGKYRSIEHCAMVNSESERLSIATFCNASFDKVIRPTPSLVTPQAHSPPLFRTLTQEEYAMGLFTRKLDGKSYLDSMRIHHSPT